MTVPAELRRWCLDNGWDPDSARPLSGGVVNTVVRLWSDAGESVVAKCTTEPPDALFAAEADGLRSLAATGLVPVPDVLAVGAHYLILTDLGSSDLDDVDWAGVGRRIAALHGVSAPRFGADRDNYLGLLPQRNPWTDDGHEFFAQHRLLRYLDEPRAAAALTADDRRRLHLLAERLPQLVPADPPALLHGDLWSGNIVGNAVIDPAAYFGWPEAELSMLWCCGNVDRRFFDAYRDVRPLQAGWQERMPLLHLREHLSVLAHFGEQSGALTEIRAVLNRFVG